MSLYDNVLQMQLGQDTSLQTIYDQILMSSDTVSLISVDSVHEDWECQW